MSALTAKQISVLKGMATGLAVTMVTLGFAISGILSPLTSIASTTPLAIP